MPTPLQPLCLVDFDDTLAATRKARLRGLRLLRELGVDTDRFAAIDAGCWERFARGETTYPELIRARWLEYGLKGDQAERLDSIYRGCLDSVNPHSGAHRLLKLLSARGYRLVILTNGSSANQRQRIARTGLDRLVETVLTSEELGHPKPDSRAFHRALDLLGADPRRTVMVGDSWHNDIEGAISAGLSGAVWVGGKLPAPAHVAVASSLQEVPGALASFELPHAA